MAENSKIEWTHHTFNPWRGCSKVSPGCQNCYAEKMSVRNPTILGVWGKNGTRAIAAESYWREPIRWNREAEKAGERHRVFCASLADVFEGPETMPENSWPLVLEAQHRLFALITETPHLDWLLLTKRPENVMKMTPFKWRNGFPDNVWIGTSVENQEQEHRIRVLVSIPSVVRFLSMEPLLGPVDLYRGGWSFLKRLVPPPGNKGGWDRGVDWVIVGGESGPNARPMHPEWARWLRDECQAAGVPFFFKQWGEWHHGSQFKSDAKVVLSDGRVVDPATPYALMEVDRSTPLSRLSPTMMCKIGKDKAGRLLDGREWNEFPAPRKGDQR